ncbi:MAG: hypothetical protein FD147_1944 [Chloroflexi bacterium]|nr:MAG: hypothetical protein FD147_1944 [Chloroflexota bacterium]MBA4376093.1 hypothetical protein [Anaerolinea sp.]
MKVKHKIVNIYIILLCVLLLLTGCLENKNAQENIIIPVLSSPTATQIVYSESYPSTPEDVIREFLAIYPDSPVHAIKFLSPAYVQRLDERSALDLLPEQGRPSGFIISQGSSSAESEKSEVFVNIAYNDNTYEAVFSLIIQGGRWLIEKIAQQ